MGRHEVGAVPLACMLDTGPLCGLRGSACAERCAAMRPISGSRTACCKRPCRPRSPCIAWTSYRVRLGPPIAPMADPRDAIDLGAPIGPMDPRVGGGETATALCRRCSGQDFAGTVQRTLLRSSPGYLILFTASANVSRPNRLTMSFDP